MGHIARPRLDGIILRAILDTEAAGERPTTLVIKSTAADLRKTLRERLVWWWTELWVLGLYERLDAMENDGLLRSVSEPGGPERGYRDRRLYYLTENCRRRIGQSWEMCEECGGAGQTCRMVVCALPHHCCPACEGTGRKGGGA